VIQGIAFQYYRNEALFCSNQTIYLGTTTKSGFVNTSDWVPLSALTQVFSGTVTFNNSNAWFYIDFDAPFEYTGGNLVIAYLNNHGANLNFEYSFYHHQSSNKTLVYHTDGGPINPATLSYSPATELLSHRNNMKLKICNASNITNTKADFSCPGQVTVTYDLTTSQPVDVTLYYSHNQCDWLVAQTVSGDLFNQTTGTGKTIIWYNYTDNVRFGKFYFKVEAPQPDPDCVMINGICWATCNVNMPGTFAANPENYGMFYQWGSNVGWSSTDPLTASDGINIWRDLSETGNVWLPEKDPCPAGWRVPTLTEIQKLLQTPIVTNLWTTENGINGLRFTELGTGNTLFFPSTGNRNNIDGTLSSAGSTCFYRSSTDNTACCAFILRYSMGNAHTASLYRNSGFSVRCVKE